MSNYCAANNTIPLNAELQCTKLLETGSTSENCINSKSELSDRLKLYLWNETGKITKVIDSSNMADFSPKQKQAEIVLIGHDMAENGYLNKIYHLVPKIYAKRPGSIVYSIDWSGLVSTYFLKMLFELLLLNSKNLDRKYAYL